MEEFYEGLSNVRVNKDMDLYPPRNVLVEQSKSGKKHIIMEGDWEGRHFIILRHKRGFPDAYVEIKKEDYMYTHEYEEFDGFVHDGISYIGEAYWNKNDNRMYIGWAYDAGDDFNSYSGDGNKKWTILEILMDISGVHHDIEWMNDIHADAEG